MANIAEQLSVLNQVFDIESLPKIAEDVVKQLSKKTVLFYGEMGSGKTTLISTMVKVLGGSNASSPTFSIVNEYQVNDGLVFHFDFYRIENVYEALDLGFEDYLNSDAWVFIEWPEKIETILPEGCAEVHLSIETDGRRRIRLKT